MKRYESLEIGCHKVTVKYVDRILDDEENKDLFGKFNPVTNEILIALTVNGYSVSEDVLDHTLHHEVGHLMLGLMNSDKNDDEPFVDMLGMMMSQFNKTKKQTQG